MAKERKTWLDTDQIIFEYSKLKKQFCENIHEIWSSSYQVSLEVAAVFTVQRATYSWNVHHFNVEIHTRYISVEVSACEYKENKAQNIVLPMWNVI